MFQIRYEPAHFFRPTSGHRTCAVDFSHDDTEFSSENRPFYSFLGFRKR
jgi:hypothetical protein